jgi:nitrogen fixation protein FixH
VKHPNVLPVAVAGAVLAVTALTIWVGAAAREDTVVDRPYEEGLRYGEARRAATAGGERATDAACDLGARPCTFGLGDLELTAELGPRPLAPMRALDVSVALRSAGVPLDGAEVTVSFAMPGMHMGENAVALAPAGAGRYAGTAVLVRCPSGRRDWIATVSVRQGGAERRAELALHAGD